MTTTILVTGATGNIGYQVATELLQHEGLRVRVAVRSRDAAKAVALAERGAELVRLDYTEPGTLQEASAGADRAFLVSPLVEDLDRLMVTAIDAVKQAGVSHVVRVSAHGANAEGPFALARWHGKADDALARSGIGYTILQPTFFQDNVINFHGDTIRGQGAFYGASGEGQVAYISSADIARAAAAVLLEPEPHAGKSYLLTGGEALSDAEVAGLLSEVTGKSISYVNLEPDQLAGGMRQSGAPDWLVEALLALESVKAQGWASQPSPAVVEITGREPERYRAYLNRSAGALS